MDKQTFRWKLKDREVSLEEMDANFKLKALLHCIKLSNKHDNFKQKKERYITKLVRKKEEHERLLNNIVKEIDHEDKKLDDLNTKILTFVEMADILEDSLKQEHGIHPPMDIQDLWAFIKLKEKNYNITSEKV